MDTWLAGLAGAAGAALPLLTSATPAIWPAPIRLPQKAPSLITPTFFSDRVTGLTPEQSAALVDALKAGGQLTPEGAQTGVSAFDAAVQQVGRGGGGGGGCVAQAGAHAAAAGACSLLGLGRQPRCFLPRLPGWRHAVSLAGGGPGPAGGHHIRAVRGGRGALQHG